MVPTVYVYFLKISRAPLPLPRWDRGESHVAPPPPLTAPDTLTVGPFLNNNSLLKVQVNRTADTFISPATLIGRGQGANKSILRPIFAFPRCKIFCVIAVFIDKLKRYNSYITITILNVCVFYIIFMTRFPKSLFNFFYTLSDSEKRKKNKLFSNFSKFHPQPEGHMQWKVDQYIF